uniref:Uncharacterized protein n=1 Tax=Pygocentrus nattereri TaxID=42514 RepID=A0A3B4DMZ3_PYGNA
SFSLPTFDKFSTHLTYDFHYTVLGLDRELLRGKMVHIQADLPAIRRLLDLRHACAELAGHGAGRKLAGHGGTLHQRGHLSRHGWADVAGPVAAGEEGQLLREGGHAECLVKQPAALMPVTERIPGWSTQEGEGDAPLGHGWTSVRLVLEALEASPQELSQESSAHLEVVGFYKPLTDHPLWTHPLALPHTPKVSCDTHPLPNPDICGSD